MQLRQAILFSIIFVFLPIEAGTRQKNLRVTVLKHPTEVYSPFQSKLKIGRLKPGSLVVKIPRHADAKFAEHLIMTNVGLIESKSLSSVDYLVTLTEFTSPPIACESDMKLATFSCRGGSESEGQWQLKFDRLKFFTIIKEECPDQGSISLNSGTGFTNFEGNMIGPARTDFEFYRANDTGEVLYAHAWIKPYCF
ncbi:MAG: hypothetical protein U1F27_03230 [Turneriella sp.]